MSRKRTAGQTPRRGEVVDLSDAELEELASRQRCPRTRYAVLLALRYRRVFRRFMNDGRLRR